MVEGTKQEEEHITFSKEQLPSNPETWDSYRKTTLTKMRRIYGAFTVMTDEGLVRCKKGFLAIDARGFPYPIAADEHENIYELEQGEDALDAAKFKPGDIVTLKSGGPCMTVGDVGDYEGVPVCQCAWFDAGVARERAFPLVVLVADNKVASQITLEERLRQMP